MPDKRGSVEGQGQGLNEVVIKLDKMMGGQRTQKRRMTISYLLSLTLTLIGGLRSVV